MTPAYNAPGTLREQFTAIVRFLALPDETREERREEAWEAILDEVVEHRAIPQRHSK